MFVLLTAIALLLIRVYRGGDWLENAGWATCARDRDHHLVPALVSDLVPAAGGAGVTALPAPHRRWR